MRSDAPFLYLLARLSVSDGPAVRTNGAPEMITFSTKGGEQWFLMAYPANLLWCHTREEWRLIGRREVALWRLLRRRARCIPAHEIPPWARHSIQPDTFAAGPMAQERLRAELATEVPGVRADEIESLLVVLCGTQCEAHVMKDGACRVIKWRPLRGLAFEPGVVRDRQVMVQLDEPSALAAQCATWLPRAR